MELSGVRLSICIATHNRASYLPQTLESVVPQLTDDVELLIVDGASTDSTPEVGRRWAEQDPRVRYVRLPVKGGVDRDYCQAVELARGEACWFFTDDDLLRTGAVAAVLAALARGVDLVVVNAEVMDRELRRTLQARMVEAADDREYGPHELERLFEDVIPYVSFIGAVVVRRALWLSRERERYLGSEFVHVGVLFQAPLPGGALLIARPLIAVRYGNASWSPRRFSIWMFQWPELIHSLSAVRDATRERLVRREPWRRLGALLCDRARGAYDLATYRERLRARPASPGWRGAALAISVAPRAFAGRFALWWLTRIRARPDPLTVYDLERALAESDGRP